MHDYKVLVIVPSCRFLPRRWGFRVEGLGNLWAVATVVTSENLGDVSSGVGGCSGFKLELYGYLGV